MLRGSRAESFTVAKTRNEIATLSSIACSRFNHEDWSAPYSARPPIFPSRRELRSTITRFHRRRSASEDRKCDAWPADGWSENGSAGIAIQNYSKMEFDSLWIFNWNDWNPGGPEIRRGRGVKKVGTDRPRARQIDGKLAPAVGKSYRFLIYETRRRRSSRNSCKIPILTSPLPVYSRRSLHFLFFFFSPRFLSHVLPSRPLFTGRTFRSRRNRAPRDETRRVVQRSTFARDRYPASLFPSSAASSSNESRSLVARCFSTAPDEPLTKQLNPKMAGSLSVARKSRGARIMPRANHPPPLPCLNRRVHAKRYFSRRNLPPRLMARTFSSFLPSCNRLGRKFPDNEFRQFPLLLSTIDRS